MDHWNKLSWLFPAFPGRYPNIHWPPILPTSFFLPPISSVASQSPAQFLYFIVVARREEDRDVRWHLSRSASKRKEMMEGSKRTKHELNGDREQRLECDWVACISIFRSVFQKIFQKFHIADCCCCCCCCGVNPVRPSQAEIPAMSSVVAASGGGYRRRRWWWWWWWCVQLQDPLYRGRPYITVPAMRPG